MKTIHLGIAATLISTMFIGAARGSPLSERTSFIDDLLSKMSLVEKLGQMDMSSAPSAERSGETPLATGNFSSPNPDRATTLDDIRAGKIGSFLNAWGVATLRPLQKVAVEESPHHIPLLFAFDVVHGHRTIFPAPLGEAASWDVDLVQRASRAAAIEADSQGLHWTFAPNADLARDARWGRVVESFGEDPYLASEMVRAKVVGFQGPKLGENGSLAATLKHFVAYSAVQAGRDYNSVSLSPTDLFNFHMPAFVEGVVAGARSVMPSFTDVDSVPMSVNQPLLFDVLRRRMGFAGVTVSDWEAIREVIAHGVAVDALEAARKGLRAQLDVDMVGRVYRTLATASLSDEEKKLIDASARRVIELKWDLGLFKDPYRNLDPQRETQALLTGETRRLAREAVTKTTVLLQNKGVLPLKKGAKSVALIGTLADEPLELIGAWPGDGRTSEVVTVREAFSQPGYFKRFWYAKGSRAIQDKRTLASISYHGRKVPRDARTESALLAEAVKRAKAADVTIAVIGELSIMSGENASRSEITIPPAQLALLRALRKASKKLVTIVVAGRPLIMNEAMDLSDAVLYAWHPGTEGGSGLRDLVLGEAVPSGKTAISFPRAIGQLPLFYNHKPTGRPPEPGKPYRSTYVDVANDALIPFGFGLSYANFVYSPPKISKGEMVGDGKDSVTVSVDVRNVSEFAADEIVQLYLRDEVASIARPVMELKGFRRVTIKAHEQKTVDFRVGLDDLSFFNVNLERVAEPGRFQAMVGPDSAHLARVSFVLKK